MAADECRRLHHRQALTVDPSARALSPGLAYAIETDTSVPGFSGVYLAVVPEPGTTGLMILAALLLRRYLRLKPFPVYQKESKP